MSRLLAVAALLAVVACASPTPRWSKPGATLQQLEDDRAQCLAATDEHLATGERRPNYAALDQCMRLKGYVSTR